jgi:hypothetical protein
MGAPSVKIDWATLNDGHKLREEALGNCYNRAMMDDGAIALEFVKLSR